MGCRTDMEKPEKTIILLALFTILTLISVITVYAVHQTPTEETITNTLCTYKSTATYDYTAILEPNTIYNNKTTLKPNEGTLYTRITKQINITLTYTFHTTLSTETTITYTLTQTLMPWQYQITATPPTTNQTQIKTTIPPINKNALQTVKTTIEQETGTSTSTYSLEITPTFTINANTQAGPIHQVFTPTLTINFKRTEQGDIITIEDLHQTKLGEITENQTKTRYDVINQRYASYILTTLSIAGLFFSAYFHRKVKPTTKKIPLDKLTAPYKDLIIEAKETAETAEITTIAVKTIEDLAKTAEILARPILHATDGKEHVFYIIDNNTKYQYKTKI